MEELFRNMTTAAQVAVTINLLVFIGIVVLGIWACIWSHLAFLRWETREEAKLRALQRIAAALHKDGTGA